MCGKYAEFYKNYHHPKISKTFSNSMYLGRLFLDLQNSLNFSFFLIIPLKNAYLLSVKRDTTF